MVMLAGLHTAASGLHVLADGRCALASTSDGVLVMGGSDDGNGGVVLVQASSDKSPSIASGKHDGLPTTTTAVGAAHAEGLIAIADGESSTVTLYSIPAMQPQGVVCRMGLAVRAVCFSADDSRVAAGGDEGVIRVVQRADTTLDVFELAVKQPIKALEWDPLGRYLAATTSRGSLSVFDLDPTVRSLVKEVEGLKMTHDAAPAYHTVEHPVAWHPSGDVLAVGTDDGALVLKRGAPWSVVYTLRSPSAVPASEADCFSGTSALAWSPNGRFIAAMDGRRVVTIWNMTEAAVDEHTDLPIVTSAASGAGEPRRVLHGYVRLFTPEATDAPRPAVVVVPRALQSSARPTGLVWLADGNGLGIVDADGFFGCMLATKALEAKGGALHPLPADVVLQWPIIVRAAPAVAATAAAAAGTKTSGGVASVLAAAAAAAEAQKLPRKSAYADGEADEGSTSDDEEDDEASGAAGKGKGGARAPATTAAAADPVDASLSAMKRSLGFVDDDTFLGEDGVGGLRYIADGDAASSGEDPALPAGAASASSVAALLARSGRFVTSDALEAHTVSTGRYVQEVYGLIAPQLPFQPGSTGYRLTLGRGARGGGSGEAGVAYSTSPASAPRGAKRYLTWNLTGAVTSRVEGPLEHTIDVEFTDSARFRSLHVTDSYGYSMAALGETGVLFGTRYVPPKSSRERVGDALDEGTPAFVYFIPLATWGAGGAQAGSWKLDFPVFKPNVPAHKFPSRLACVPARRGGRSHGGDAGADGGDDGIGEVSGAAAAPADDGDEHGDDDDDALDTSDAAESPVSLAVGDGWVVAATDRQFLRFFRSGGAQDAVIALAGAPVCVAAHGALVAVAYHDALPSHYTQRLRVDLFVYKGFEEAPEGKSAACASWSGALPRRIASVALPLRPRSTLTWMGFSADGTLMAHDSDGVLFGLHAGLGWSWSPVADTRAAGLALVASSSSASEGEVGKKRARHDPRDSYWPIGVGLVRADMVQAPNAAAAAAAAAASSSSSSSSSSAAASSAAFGIGTGATRVLALLAVLCKGANTQPGVTTPRPLAVYLPLRAPLLDAREMSAFDEEYGKWELRRLQRSWVVGEGLGHESAASVALSTALTAASASLRGDASFDALDALMAANDDATAADVKDAADIDKAIVRMIKSACEGERDVRAFHLATRLHTDKSIEIAAMLATRCGRAGVAERILKLLTVRLAMANDEEEEEGAAAAAAPRRSAAAAASGSTAQQQRQVLDSAPAGAAAAVAPPRFGLASSSSSSSSSRAGAATAASSTSNSSAATVPARRPQQQRQQRPRDDDENDDAHDEAGEGAAAGPVNPFSLHNSTTNTTSPAKQRRPQDSFAALNMSPAASMRAQQQPQQQGTAAAAANSQRGLSQLLSAASSAPSASATTGAGARGGGSGQAALLNRQSSFATEVRSKPRANA